MSVEPRPNTSAYTWLSGAGPLSVVPRLPTKVPAGWFSSTDAGARLMSDGTSFTVNGKVTAAVPPPGLGLNTLMVWIVGVPVSVGVSAARTRLGLTKKVGRSKPFTRTTVVLLKFAPSTWSIVLPAPSFTKVGLMVLRIGNRLSMLKGRLIGELASENGPWLPITNTVKPTPPVLTATLVKSAKPSTAWITGLPCKLAPVGLLLKTRNASPLEPSQL